MFAPRLMQRLAAFVIAVAIPFTSSAAAIADILKTPDAITVSRGDFLRASVIALGLKTDKTVKPANKYSRPVPRTLQPYVVAAEKQKAMTVFGTNLGLSNNITRGEAITLVAKLGKMKPVNRTDYGFSDVTKGSDIEDAVRIAVENDWVKPTRPNLFGLNVHITGAEARQILSRATKEKPTGTVETGTEQPKVPTIFIQSQKKESVQIPESELLRTVWQLLNDQYLYKDKIITKDAAYKAAEGLVNSLNDPYTTFMRPADAKNFQEQITGEVTGIGAQVEYKDDALIIVSPLSGSPAEKAGIRPGDKITGVDGKSLSGLTLGEAVAKVRGPKGTSVTLTINRDGNIMEIKVTRDAVRTPEIDISFQNGIAVVKVSQFGKTTDTQLRTLMADVQKQKPQGVVLDIRNNPGGLLHAAEIMVSNFLPEGSGVAQIKSKTENYTEVTQDPPTIGEDVPVVVLVNKGSASASEIVAGALQDHKRATIIGVQTFGKGTVQQVIEFRDGSSMKMTIAEWLTPKGRVINGAGVTPDIVVNQTEARDEQLLRAFDTLR
jgi:carboxyl-terminal processing protease